MHFLWSLLFLFATIALVVAYLIIFYLIAVGLQRARHRYRLRYSLDRNAVLQKKLWPVFPKAKFKKVTILVGLILCLFYVQQRVKWMGDDNANLEAKEFWVAGQVVAGIRFAAIRVLHPENPLLLPLNALQNAIYRQGIQYLPPGDGEVGVWTDLWLLYPYNYRLRLPYFVDVKSDNPSPKMRRLLDKCWFALEKMATGNYADRQIEIECFYRNFPALALYYDIYDGFYGEKYANSDKQILKNKDLFNRIQLLLKWLEGIKLRWKNENIYHEIKTKFTIVEVYRVTAVLNLAQSILVGTALNGNFSCKGKYNRKLIEVLESIMAGSPSKNIFLFYSKKGKNEYRRVRNFYKELLYSLQGGFCEYVLRHFCKMNFPKENFIFITETEYHGKWDKHFIESAYKEEIKQIKERTDG